MKREKLVKVLAFVGAGMLVIVLLLGVYNISTALHLLQSYDEQESAVVEEATETAESAVTEEVAEVDDTEASSETLPGIEDSTEELTTPPGPISAEEAEGRQMVMGTDVENLPVDLTDNEESQYDVKGRELMQTQEFIDFANSEYFVFGIDDIEYDYATVFEDYVQYWYKIDKTDAVFCVEDWPDKELQFLDVQNKYDPIYSVVVFENCDEVPDVAVTVYEHLMLMGAYIDWYYTDYVPGDDSVTVTGYTTELQYTVEL